MGRQESATMGTQGVAHQDRADRAWHGHWTRSFSMGIHKQDASLSRRAALAGLGAGGLGLAVAATARPLAAQDATPGAPAVTVERDVVYGEVDGQELLLDVTRPAERDEPRPAVLLFHGGAW